MEILWSPWRLRYVVSTSKPSTGCVFCDAVESEQPETLGVLYDKGPLWVIVNKFPYNNGHVMIFPVRHIASFEEFNADELARLGPLIKATETILRTNYHPHGVNVGVNIGEAAGAGIAQHLHVHLLPRWRGDTNFMTATAETRIVPETSEDTVKRLRPHFEKLELG